MIERIVQRAAVVSYRAQPEESLNTLGGRCHGLYGVGAP